MKINRWGAIAEREASLGHSRALTAVSVITAIGPALHYCTEQRRYLINIDEFVRTLSRCHGF